MVSHQIQTLNEAIWNLLYIISCLLLRRRLIFLRILKVFDEPLGQSNTERRVKISASMSKKAPYNIFIVKLKISPLG